MKFSFLHIASLDALILKQAEYDIDLTEHLSEDIETMYRWEYKYHKIQQMNMFPRRKENILKNIEQSLEPVLDSIRETLIDVFGNWLAAHAITNPQQWAEVRVDKDFEVGEGEAGAFEAAFQEWSRYVRGFDQRPKVDYRGIRRDDPKQQGEFAQLVVAKFPEYYTAYANEYNDLQIDDTRYEMEHTNDEDELQELQERLDELEKYDDMSGEDLSRWMSDMYGDTELFNLIQENCTYDQLVGIRRDIVFPVWYSEWGAQGIDAVRDDIENIYDKMENARGMKEAIPIISMALNAVHMGGSMLDYIQESKDSNVTEQFLDNMSNLDTEELDKEIEEMLH